MKNIITWGRLAVLASLVLALPTSARAQEAVRADSTVVYTFVLVGIPLDQALNTLIDRSDINLFFESRLVRGKRSHCTIQGANLESVLRCVLQGTTLDYFRLSSGMYVLTAGAKSEPLYGYISGFVIDSDSELPIENASVLLPEAGVGTATNRSGWFQIPRLLPGAHQIVITHVAYREVRTAIDVQPIVASTMRIALDQRIVQSEPVVVNGFTIRQPSSLLGIRSRDAEALSDMPGGGFAIAQDVMGIPGISSGEALGDVHVQGSDAGAHEYLLDEAPVYMPIKNGNFIGPFSPLAIRNISIQSAGFPARVGSQLAGVVEINQRIPGRESQSTTVQADPLAFNARNEHTIALKNGRTFGWVLAGRKAMWRRFHPDPLNGLYLDWSRPDVFLANQIGAATGTQFPPGHQVEVDFFDIHGSFSLDLGNARNLSASTYIGHNVFGSPFFKEIGAPGTQFSDEYTWDNRMTQIRYEWLQGSRIFMHVGLWQSDYRLDHPFAELPLSGPGSDGKLREFNEIDQLGGRIRADFSLGNRLFLKTGLIGRISDSDFAISTRPLLDAPDLTPTTTVPSRWLFTAFVDQQYAISDRNTLEFGSRFSVIPSHNRVYIEPRISWRRDVAFQEIHQAAFRISAGVYRQYTSQFDLAPFTESALLPSFRFWIPTGKKDRPPYAFHLAGNALLKVGQTWEFEWDSFLKYTPRMLVLDYSREAQFPIAGAKARSLGASVSAVYRIPSIRLKGWYGIEQSIQKQSDRFENDWVSTPWESPHKLGFSGDVSIASGLQLNATASATLGRTWGYRLSYYNYLPLVTGAEDIASLRLGDPESHGLPDLFRVDLALSYRHSLRGSQILWRLSALNVTDHANTVDWMILGPEINGAPDRINRYGLPRLVLLSLKVSL